MPSRVAASGPIVDPHGIALFETNSWDGTPACGGTRRAQSGRADRVGRVALVGVELQQRAAAEDRAVGGVVPLGVVRVHGVPGVGRDEPRRGERLPPLDLAGAEPGRDAHEHVFEHRAARARAGLRAELLVVERGEHADVAGVVGRREQRDEPGVHRGQVVHPPGGEEHVVEAEPRRRLRVGERAGRAPRRRRPRRRRVASAREQVGVASRSPRTPDGLRVPLLVEREPLVDRAVEVDRQLRDAQHRAGAHEVRRRRRR